LHVTIVDKAVFPRDKTCGDGLTASALRLYEQLGLEPERVASWAGVDEAGVVSPSGRQVEQPLPAGAGRYAAVAPRLGLADALVRRWGGQPPAMCELPARSAPRLRVRVPARWRPGQCGVRHPSPAGAVGAAHEGAVAIGARPPRAPVRAWRRGC